MKSKLILLGIFLAGFCCYAKKAKYKIYNNDKVYKYIHNSVWISVKEIDCSRLQLKSDDIQIRKKWACVFMVRSLKGAGRYSAKLYDVDRFIGDVSFNFIDSIPQPQIQMIWYTTVGITRLHPWDTLKPRVPGDDSFNLKVLEYSVEIYKEKSKVFSERVRGNKLSENFWNMYLRSKYNDPVIFSDIVMVDDENDTLHIAEYILPK